MSVGAIVLAAGAGRRFTASGGPGSKLVAAIGGEPMVAVVLEAALASGLAEVVLVQGAADLSGHAPAGVVVLDNRRWAEGMATSLQVGIDHARRQGHEAVVVGLADQPGVVADAWRALAAVPAEPPIAVATYGGRRGNPVRLHRAVWGLLPVTGDEGARSLIREQPDLVRAVPCTGEPFDVDTLEDLDRWS